MDIISLDTSRTRTQERIKGLESQLEEMEIKYNLVQYQPDHQPSTTDISNDHSANNKPLYPKLIHAALLLSKVLSSCSDSFVVGTTDEVVAQQLVTLAEQARDELNTTHSSLSLFQTTLSSFLAINKCQLKIDNTTSPSTLESTLGALSHKVSQAAKDAAELVHVREQLQTLTEREEKAQRSILALQTQLGGLQASKTKKDQSLVAREAELMAVMEKKDQALARLEAQNDQLRGELENTHQNMEDLERHCTLQQKELSVLQRKCEAMQMLETENSNFQEQIQELQQSAREYEEGYLGLLRDAERAKTQTEVEKAELVATTEAQVLSTEKQALFELQARVSACEADKLIAIQDTKRLQQELDALDRVLVQFRTDHKQMKERMLELENALEQSKIEADTVSKTSVVSDDELHRLMNILSKKTHECDQLREALENAAKRYSSETDVLDKRLAAQLVLSYVESDKKSDVLQLISRMMGFTDDEKRRAGISPDGSTIVIPGYGGGGIFSTIFGGPTPDSQREQVSQFTDTSRDTLDKSFADVWTNFLLDEANK